MSGYWLNEEDEERERNEDKEGKEPVTQAAFFFCMSFNSSRSASSRRAELKLDIGT